MKFEGILSKIPKFLSQKFKLGRGGISNPELDDIRLSDGGYGEIVAVATETNIFTNATVPQFPTGYDFKCEEVQITNTDPLNEATVELYDGATAVAANQRGTYIVPPGMTQEFPDGIRFTTDVRALSNVGAALVPVTVKVMGKLML
jgi:hypothetical protein